MFGTCKGTISMKVASGVDVPDGLRFLVAASSGFGGNGVCSRRSVRSYEQDFQWAQWPPWHQTGDGF
jgi:hypothetical protein